MIKKNIFNWKNNFLRPQSYKAYYECLNYEMFQGCKKHKMSLDKRCALVEYAYTNCSFYREYYNSKGFHPSMLTTEADWEKVPVLEKWMIREDGKKMFSDIAELSRLSPSKTGGSTGKPLVVYKSKDVHFEVLAWRALSWYGVAPWMNEAIVHRRVPMTFIEKLINIILKEDSFWVEEKEEGEHEDSGGAGKDVNLFSAVHFSRMKTQVEEKRLGQIPARNAKGSPS